MSYSKNGDQVSVEAADKSEDRSEELTHRKATTETKAATATVDKPKDKGCESDEVLAVLCHEFGHWALSHNVINLCISFVSHRSKLGTRMTSFFKLNLFLVFSVFAALFKRRVLYQAFGFTKTKPILMGLLIIFQYVLSPYFEVGKTQTPSHTDHRAS